MWEVWGAAHTLPQDTEESNVAKQFGEFALLNTYCTYTFI